MPQDQQPALAAPHSFESEQAVLGAILLNPAAYHMVRDILKPDDFFEPLHRMIYDVAGTRIREGKQATPGMLLPYLPVGEIDQGVTVQAYLARLCAEAATVVLAPDYAQTVADMAQRRAIMAWGQEIVDQARDLPVSMRPTALLDAAEGKLHEARAQIPQPVETHTIGDLVAALADRAESKEFIPIPTSGFVDIDKYIGGGLRPGRLIILGARPGMGKTAWQIASARRSAQTRIKSPVDGSETRFGVGFFSLEIEPEEMAARTAASYLSGGINPISYAQLIRGRGMNPEDLWRVREAAEHMKDVPLLLDCTTGLTVSAIESRARKMQEDLAKIGLKLGSVGVDYLGLVRPTQRYSGKKVDEVGEVALGLKEMAKRLQTCVIASSQLSRSVEARDDKRPVMSDLRDSGNIEEHADIIAFLYRPAYYDERNPKWEKDQAFMLEADLRKNELEFILAKNRLGPTKNVKLYIEVARNLVDNGAPEYDDPRMNM